MTKADNQEWAETADPVVWNTADGRFLTMEEITDDHLLNIIPHLRGVLAGAQAEYDDISVTQMGDDAKDAALGVIRSDMELIQNDIDIMTGEAERRGLANDGMTI